jgi:hypothetical protein
LAHARSHSREHPETRGASSDFAPIKDQLREWIESRLTPPTRSGEDTVTAFQLNTELAKAGIDCDYHPEAPESGCRDQDLTGFLGDVQLHRSDEFLVVQTAVGIQCGYDESAYIYERKDNRWQPFWESQQDNYTKDKYVPQNSRSVLISPADYRPDGDKTAHVIVTLGTYPRCSSNWYPIYYRIWQTKSGEPTKLLLDENEVAFLAEPIQAAVWADDVLIEYAVGSIDGDVHNRRQIRHFAVKQGMIERIDPVVLSPRDFVDHWISGSSKEVLAQTAPDLKAALDNWSRRFKGPFEFIDPACHCTQKPDLWQVGVRDPTSERPLGYFLIRWRPPYHFSMAGVGAKPWPDCTGEDPEADAFHTLFPGKDYH